MTPTELEAAVTKTEDLVLAACPVVDQTTGQPKDMRSKFGYTLPDIRKALSYYNATPSQIAASIVATIKSVAPFDDLPGYEHGYQFIGSEGYTGLAVSFAPKKSTGVHAGPTPAEIKANALQTANVQKAHDLMDAMKADGAAPGKAFLGLDGVAYDQYKVGYEAAATALIAAADASAPPSPAPTSKPAPGTGGTLSPGKGIA